MRIWVFLWAWSQTGWKRSSGIPVIISVLFYSLLLKARAILYSLFFIIPVFTALFLYHREQFVLFLNAVFGEKYHSRLHIVLRESSYAYYKYVIGVIKVYLIVGTLNSIGLLVLGIEHAVFFGMLAAFMTIIPYIGIILSALLPVSVAWATKDLKTMGFFFFCFCFVFFFGGGGGGGCFVR